MTMTYARNVDGFRVRARGQIPVFLSDFPRQSEREMLTMRPVAFHSGLFDSSANQGEPAIQCDLCLRGQDGQ